MNRISELRKKLGLTQTRLGEEIGVSQQTISKYENVDENISGDMLLALSKFFKVPVDYILRKDEEEQQSIVVQLSRQKSKLFIMN